MAESSCDQPGSRQLPRRPRGISHAPQRRSNTVPSGTRNPATTVIAIPGSGLLSKIWGFPFDGTPPILKSCQSVQALGVCRNEKSDRNLLRSEIPSAKTQTRIFGWRGDSDRLPGVSSPRFCGKVTAFCEVSGCLRAVAGPKQFEKVVRGTDQLPFRTGFRDSA